MLSDVHCRLGLAQQDPERARIVEAVDVFRRPAVVCLQTMRGEDCNLSLSAGVPRVPPDQLGRDGFKERLNRRIEAPIFVKRQFAWFSGRIAGCRFRGRCSASDIE